MKTLRRKILLLVSLASLITGTLLVVQSCGVPNDAQNEEYQAGTLPRISM
jgi:hypothetical protein